MMFDRALYRPLAVIAAALLLAACAEGEAGDSGGEEGGGPVAVATLRPITTLDPHGDMAGDLGTQLASKAIFNRLVNTDGDPYGPELATEWTVSPDATQWRFTIRDDVTFSDGTPLTANDVVASIERLKELEGPMASNFAALELDAPDDHTVVFTGETGDPALLGKLIDVWIVPGDRAGGEGFFAEPVGSGPYLVESFTPEETLALVPNPDYWGGAPAVEQLELRYIPETAARMTALRTGEVDLTWGVPDDQVPGLRNEESLTLESVASNATYTMWFNSSRPAFADAEVRRALWQAVNFEEIIASLHPETGEPAVAVVGPPVLGHAPQPPVTYDPEAARVALAAADFDFDATFQLQLRGAEFRQFAQAVASDLREIGVQVEPIEKEPGVWLEDLLALNWDINLQSLAVPSLDAATNVGRLYPCEANRTGYCNPGLDALLAEANSIADQDRRAELYGEAQQIIWGDAVGMFPMVPKVIYARDSRLAGVDLDASSIPHFKNLTWEG